MTVVTSLKWVWGCEEIDDNEKDDDLIGKKVGRLGNLLLAKIYRFKISIIDCEKRFFFKWINFFFIDSKISINFVQSSCLSLSQEFGQKLGKITAHSHVSFPHH